MWAGLLAALLHVALMVKAPLPPPLPVIGGVAAWLAWLASSVNRLGPLLALVVAGPLLIDRLRDHDLRVTVLLWLAAGSAMGLGGVAGLGTMALGGALAALGAVSGPVGAGGPILVCLGLSVAGLGSIWSPLVVLPIVFCVLVGRGGRPGRLMGAIASIILGAMVVVVIWRLRTGSWSAPWLHVLHGPMGRPAGLLAALGRDPFLLAGIAGIFTLARLGVGWCPRVTLGASVLMALGAPVWLPVTEHPELAMAALAPVLVLGLAAFLDRAIARRSIWLGGVLGSLLMAALPKGPVYVFHGILAGRIPQLGVPWWPALGAPRWQPLLPWAVALLVALVLIARGLGRVPGWPARALHALGSMALAASVWMLATWL